MFGRGAATGVVLGESRMGMRYRNDFLRAMVIGGIVYVVCAIALLALWRDVVQAGCTNVLAISNANSQARADDHPISPLSACCSDSLQTNESVNISLVRQRGLYIWERDGVEAAISTLQLAADQGATDPLLLVYLGLAEMEADRLASAVETLRGVVNVDRFLDNRGRQQLETEAYKDALGTYLVATQVAPDSAAAWRGLGRAYHSLGDAPAALTAYERALVHAPDDHEAHYELGMLLWELKDSEGAINHLEQAVELTPRRDRFGYRNIIELARMQRALGLRQEALQTAQTAVRRFPQDRYAYYELGETLRLLGEAGAALEAYREAIRLQPSNAQFHFVSGLAYLQLSNRQAALQAFAEAM